jgi:signal transduction histidine kinase
LALEERPCLKAIITKKLVTDFVMGVWIPNTNERKWLLISADPILDDHGNILHIVSSFTDITERRRLEKELLTKQLNHQKQLTQATIDGQEKERLEIGKELHDNIGQQLTTIKLFLDLALSTANDTTGEMISMALKGISDVINEVRSMSRTLVPSTLKDLGLIDSVRELTEMIAKTQLLSITLDDYEFDEGQLLDNQKLMLFRIIQEQLNNVVKHAGARHVWVSLKTDDQKITLSIIDDGHGFDPKTIRKGLGFINIDNRAELFGGYTELNTLPGKGCMLKVHIPYKPHPQFLL